jgi:hypothetical protein
MTPFDRTARCIDHYRELGLCPLPSRMDRKGPMLDTYADHYQGIPVPESVYRMRSTNVQILCGTKSPTPTKIVVVDLDGPEAREVWGKMVTQHDNKPSSIWVAMTGSGGYHLYYSVPADVQDVSSGIIWGVWDTWGDKGKGKWAKHKEIRILGDNSLVVAPPSIHVDTKQPYRFQGLNNPNRVWLPDPAPKWLLEMPRLSAPRFEADTPKPAYVPRTIPRSGRFHDRDQVLAAIGTSKLAIAKEWGLQTKSDAPNPRGWVNCYVPHREDPRHSTPSGSFNFHDGTLQDRKDLTTISLFDLGVLLQPGRYRDWREVRDELGDRFIGAKNRVDY